MQIGNEKNGEQYESTEGKEELVVQAKPEEKLSA